LRTACCLVVALIVSAPPLPAAAQSAIPLGSQGVDGAPVLVSDPTLLASLRRIAAGSTLWRENIEALRGTGRYVLVLTPEHVVMADTIDGDGAGPFDPTVLAEVAPVPEDDSQVRTVLVVVNLALIERIHTQRRSLPGDLDADLDRILVHEVYGHAFPYLLAGHLSGRCPDPAPDQRATDACAVRRENAVRKELGLGRRTDYGLSGLALASAWR
jgi:hypothetical protein